MKMLTVGEKVLWRGRWGSEPGRVATVLRISWIVENNPQDPCLDDEGNPKTGIPVEAIPWDRATDREVVVDLDNGHWAYASQISPLPKRMEGVA